MTDLISKPGPYRTRDGRRVNIIGGGSIVEATNLEVMNSDGSGRYPGTSQKYWRTGAVVHPRHGEENDTIVGPWVEEITIGGQYRSHTSIVTVRAVADDFVFYIRAGNDSAGVMKVKDFFSHFTLVPPVRTVWVNVWYNSIERNFYTGQQYESEVAAKSAASPDHYRTLIATVKAEVPA